MSDHSNYLNASLSTKAKVRERNRILPLVCAVIAGTVLGGGTYHLALNQGIVPKPASVLGSDTSNQSLDVSAKIAKLMLVPNEKPSIATIVDAEKLKSSGEVFYAHARDGDKLVVYSDRAILYREQDNLIVSVVSISASVPDKK